MAIRFAHRPVVKGGTAASSSGAGTQANIGAYIRHHGMEGAGELSVGEEVVADRANGGVDPVQGQGDGCRVQLMLYKLALGVPPDSTAVTRGILHGIAPANRMPLSKGAEAQASREEDVEVVDLVLLYSTS